MNEIAVAEHCPAPVINSNKITFEALLDLMLRSDEALETAIDLKLLGELVSDKVDAIKAVVDQLEMHAAVLKANEEEIAKSRRACEANRERLRDYAARALEAYRKRLQEQMGTAFDETESTRVPGNVWVIRLQANTNPALVVKRQANAQDYRALGAGLVDMTISFAWKNDELKKRLLADEKFDFAELERGNHVRFAPNKKGKTK